MSITAHAVNFNSVYLTTIEGLSILSISVYPYDQTLNRFSIPSGDKVRVTSINLENRIISIRVLISCATREIKERSLAELSRVLQGIEKNLIIPQGGATRKYTATADKWTFESDNGSSAIISVPFVCSDQYGYDVSTTDLVNLSGIIASSRTDQISFPTGLGLAQSQLPIVQVTLNSLTQGSGQGFTITNVSTQEYVTVEASTWSASDVLLINHQTQTVTINGTETDYEGVLFDFDLGTQNIKIADDFTARNYDYHAYYTRRYL